MPHCQRRADHASHISSLHIYSFFDSSEKAERQRTLAIYSIPPPPPPCRRRHTPVTCPRCLCCPTGEPEATAYFSRRSCWPPLQWADEYTFVSIFSSLSLFLVVFKSAEILTERWTLEPSSLYAHDALWLLSQSQMAGDHWQRAADWSVANAVFRGDHLTVARNHAAKLYHAKALVHLAIA